jgi:Flp pilus assembly protein protease CpaA
MQGSLYIALILIVAMLFIPGAIEDFRKREVDDVFIFMPYISYIITYALFGVIIVAAGLFIATIIAIASYLLYRYNYIAIGDLLGLPAIFSAIYALNFIAIFISLITAFDLYRVYKKKERF